MVLAGIPPKKPRPKSKWMKGFVIDRPLTDLELAQIETQQKVRNDFRKQINRR